MTDFLAELFGHCFSLAFAESAEHTHTHTHTGNSGNVSAKKFGENIPFFGAFFSELFGPFFRCVFQ